MTEAGWPTNEKEEPEARRGGRSATIQQAVEAGVPCYLGWIYPIWKHQAIAPITTLDIQLAHIMPMYAVIRLDRCHVFRVCLAASPAEKTAIPMEKPQNTLDIFISASVGGSATYHSGTSNPVPVIVLERGGWRHGAEGLRACRYRVFE